MNNLIAKLTQQGRNTIQRKREDNLIGQEQLTRNLGTKKDALKSIFKQQRRALDYLKVVKQLQVKNQRQASETKATKRE